MRRVGKSLLRGIYTKFFPTLNLMNLADDPVSGYYRKTFIDIQLAKRRHTYIKLDFQR